MAETAGVTVPAERLATNKGPWTTARRWTVDDAVRQASPEAALAGKRVVVAS